ncbi:MAG: TonB-dependent receptor, partial [Bacteroidetes bacterium]|nr:TonB-dependent receptor [Bacteroidota bacterium]
MSKYPPISKTIIFLLIFISSFSVFSQQKFTISGYVKDSKTGESLIGANVYVKETMKGSTTNQYGFFSITVDKGQYEFVVTYVGYTLFSQKINLDKNIKQNISLSEKVTTTKEVVITGDKEDKNTKSSSMGTVTLDVEKIKTLPAFLGEVDILKTIQLTPGVQSAGEGNSGFYVRGGGPDQNLILLDEAVVYNASHLFGFFSVFNADAVKNVSLTKAGMPANYGGRLASVLDISMKEGNNRDYHADGGIGLISSRLTVQGPIKKDTSSFIISGRRTYIDVLVKPFINKSSPFKSSGYYFYDLNAKLNWHFSDKDRVFLSGYFGRDVFSLIDKTSSFNNTISWGNGTGCLRWNHLFNEKLFLNTSLIYSNYQFEFAATQSSYEIKLYSGVTDWNGKLDFNYFPSIRHNVKFGINYIYHTFVPNNASAKSGDVAFDLGKTIELFSHDGAAYINDEFDLTENIKINGGLRYTIFEQVGPFDRFLKDNLGQINDTVHYARNEKVKLYQHIEPRLSVRFNINSKSSLKASYTQNYQYIHLASVTAVSLPTDIWVPSSDIVKPQFGTQYSIGYFRNFAKNKWESSVEIYYKDMKNQIEFREGALPEDNIKDNTDNNFVFGDGWSYGAEFFVNKKVGKTTGWIGYTLAWT